MGKVILSCMLTSLILLLLLILIFYWSLIKRLFSTTTPVNNDPPQPVQAVTKISEGGFTPIKPILDSLDLIEPKQIVPDTKTLSIKDLVLVSAWSKSHSKEAEFLCRNIKQHRGFDFTRLKLLIYNLGGISIEEQELYKRNCTFAEWREPFPAKFQYPAWVTDLRTYRWKPLIIADALAQFPLVLYVDASINFRNNNTGMLHLADIIKRVANDDEWKMKMAFFAKTNVSIWAATHPGMYDYLPMTPETAMKSPMWEASHMLFFATSSTKAEILQAWTECALFRYCMAPRDSQFPCQFSNDQYKDYGNCHRYDQSALSIIVTRHAKIYNVSSYAITDSPMFCDYKRLNP